MPLFNIFGQHHAFRLLAFFEGNQSHCHRIFGGNYDSFFHSNYSFSNHVGEKQSLFAYNVVFGEKLP